MKKALAGLLVFVLLVLSVRGVAMAAQQENDYGYNFTQTEFEEYQAATQNCDTPSLECLVKYTTRFVAMEWVCDIAGQCPTESSSGDGLINDASSQQPPRGVVAGVFTLVGSMYDYQPAKTSRYVADVLDSAGLATPAYAQGLGFASLDPILGLWKMFRNVAYFFFIVVFIVIGFMIMFRAKIGGQAVITAQQAIPSVIISLVLVTFSYAIAGFMIDLMYLLMFMIIGLFSNLSGTDTSGSVTQIVSSTDLINLDIMHLIGFMFSNTISQFGTGTLISSQFLEAAGITNDFFNGLGSWLGGLTLTIIITIGALIATIKLFFELLKSYATIVLSVVFSPLALMVGAFPGKNVFMPWLKGIIGNLLAFPAVLLLIIMFIEFTKGTVSHTTEGGFMPPFLIGSGVAGMVGPLMGFAIILAMPEIVKKVKEATGASDGGFAAMIAGAAWGRAKEAWGKGFMGVSGKGVMKSPLGVAGAIGGYALARNRANEFGLEGNARRAVILGGTAAGAGVGMRLPQVIQRLGGRGINQLADVEINRQIESFRQEVQARKKARLAQEQGEIVESQGAATPSPTQETRSRGVSSESLDDMV